MINGKRIVETGLTILIVGLIGMCNSQQTTEEPMKIQETIDQAIENGEYSAATKLITQYLSEDTISEAVRDKYSFEVERMKRIRADFTKSPDEVLGYIREYYPAVRAEDIQCWDAARSLEFKIIDGEKLYFARAARNLFRIDAEMKKVWSELHPDDGITSGSGAKLDLDVHNAKIIQTANASSEKFVEPRRLHITQSLEVLADAVPAGEIVRCWLPYPRLIENRQIDIEMIQTQPGVHQLAPADALQRTVYMEKPAVAGEPTKFSVEYAFTAHGFFQAIDADKVTPLVDPASLEPFLSESAPHIIFSDELKALSHEIVGDETHPYRIAQKLFAWVDNNTPWASAREYSTIQNIPEYARVNHHGDCGIQTLFFITLCRLNGIPARWQSGWELQPPDDSMHDWGMIYFEPYGWVPMDVTYGLRKSDDPQLHWFYLSGMDSYRIIFNDDISQPFTPAKKHFRSETVDSQRGEAEWAGGNLYFDQWRWNFDWEILDLQE